jgi:hybrid cluster-associated redox disulfide protein
MTGTRILNPDLTVDEIMRRWPGTIRVMIRNRILCVGCPIGSFHTVIEACVAHGVDVETFMGELLEATRSDGRENAAREFRATGT